MNNPRLWLSFAALACALLGAAAAPRPSGAQQTQAPAPTQTPTPQREEVEGGVTVSRVVRVPVTVLD